MNRLGAAAIALLVMAGSPAAEAGEPPAGPLRVRVEVMPGPVCADVECEAPAGLVRLLPTGGDVDAEEARGSVLFRQIQGWGSLELPVPEGASGFTVEVEDPRYWSPVLVRSREVREVVLRLHPVTEVRVEARPGGGKGLEGKLEGKEVRVEFNTTPTTAFVPGTEAAKERLRNVLRGEVACSPTGKEALWRCGVPSGLMDLRFHARGFASEYRWTVPLEPFAQATLPPLELVPGSSLVGFLEVPTGGLPPDAEVQLVAAGDPRGTTGVRTLAWDAPVKERGLFQFRDLRAGFYTLHADLPGWAPAEVGPLEVLPGIETRLVELVRLREPATLTVCVDPPFPPGVRRPEDTWTVRLDRHDRPASPIVGRVDPLGCLRHRDLRPDVYYFTLGDERGSRWERRELEIRSGDQRVDLQVEHFPIEGELRRDSEPIRALLELRLMATREDGFRYHRKVDWFVDPEGRFVGSLPEPGTWYVKATFQAGGATVELGSVEIEDRPGEVQELSLEVPATELAGKVVDAEGRPVEMANVFLDRKGGPPPADRPPSPRGTTLSDEQGRYHFEGIVPGHYELTVYGNEAWASAEVEVFEDVELPGPTLVLEATRKLQGLVLGPAGGIPRARVSPIPEPRDIIFRGIRSYSTDAEGRFEITVPEKAVALRVLVAAVGHGTRVVRVPLDGEPRPLVLSLDRLSGTLRLTTDPSGPSLRRLILVADGVPMWLSLFRGLATSMGGMAAPREWVVPSMAPGEYRLCDRELESCSPGFLGVGETLVLEAGQ